MSKKDKVYSLADMSTGKMFPFIKSSDRRTYKKYIEREVASKNILNPLVMGTGNATRFYVQGANIKKLITAVKKGYTF